MSGMVERVAISIYAADGMKHAMPDITIEESWAMSPHWHDDYIRRAKAAIEAIFSNSRFVQMGDSAILANPDCPPCVWDGQKLQEISFLAV